MDISTYDAISPIDGRYRKSCESLAPFFSEASLIRYRIKVEAAYFLALCRIPLPQLQNISQEATNVLESLVKDPSGIDI
ncbi:MAG TPA: adenylosuccinate lyase, partial [Bacteroidia bacterium]|nr:adenylosuccinate lyase [Bacteroidia bacterium]